MHSKRRFLLIRVCDNSIPLCSSAGVYRPLAYRTDQAERHPKPPAGADVLAVWPRLVSAAAAVAVAAAAAAAVAGPAARPQYTHRRRTTTEEVS